MEGSGATRPHGLSKRLRRAIVSGRLKANEDKRMADPPLAQHLAANFEQRNLHIDHAGEYVRLDLAAKRHSQSSARILDETTENMKR
ncbi:MAG: hypothetical protein GC182_04060 [Rhodopseudomonas sp.]|nr:hypothetical protein [Rhodopseudomonas sp.]